MPRVKNARKNSIICSFSNELKSIGVSGKINLANFVTKYLKYLDFTKNLTRNTVRAYSTDVLQVFQLKSRVKIQGPKIEGSPDYIFSAQNSEMISKPYQEWADIAINHLRQWQGLSPKSRKRKISSLSGFVVWMRTHQKIDLPIHIQAPSGNQRKLPHFISVDECLSLLQYLKKSEETVKLKHQELLFYLLYGCGLRVSEACSIRWSDVSFSRKQIQITGKGNKQRWAILPESSYQALKRRKKNEEYIFGEKPLPQRTAYQHVKELGAAAGLIKPLHPHALRHSFATHLLASGSDLRVLQQLLGHQSLAATELYTHLNIDQLANTMETHHPLSKP